MSVTLDELVKLEGVTMAFEFTPDGKCTAYQNVTPEMAAMAARYCATVTMQFNTLARAFSALSEQEWVTQRHKTMTPALPPLMSHKVYHAASVFTPENLLLEARRRASWLPAQRWLSQVSHASH
jgi:roadblock/LC7 domain-containing protein